MSAVGAGVMFGAGRSGRENFDSLIVRTDAQSCAGLESPRARVPYMARGEFAPATTMRADALKLERKHYPPAYAARLNRQACQSTTMDSTSAAASMSRTLATIPTESRTPDLWPRRRTRRPPTR